MSRLGKASTLAEILTSIVGDIAHEARTQVVEEAWFGRLGQYRESPHSTVESRPDNPGLQSSIDIDN